MAGTLGVQEVRIPLSGTIFPASGLVGVIGIVEPTFNGTQALKGYIEKVSFEYSTASGTGSLSLFVSGTDELIVRNLGSDNVTEYPRLFPVDNLQGTGSPNTLGTRRVVNAPVYLSGAALGSPSTVFATVTYVTP